MNITETNILEENVAEHYGDKDLLTRILSALEINGYNINQLQAENLAPLEEFHIGGREATAYAISKMSLNESQHIIDIGCGIGGAARYIAANKTCKVTGIDLTPEYIACGIDLTKRVQLDDLVHLETASALKIPYTDEEFDAALTLHVAMNIENRKKLYQEIARILKPGAPFCIFDVMKKGNETLTFPVPWAKTQETSFLKTPEQTQQLLEDTGFSVTSTEDRTAIAEVFFRKQLSESKKSSNIKALGIHLIMKEQVKEKFENTLLNLEQKRIMPVQMMAVKN